MLERINLNSRYFPLIFFFLIVSSCGTEQGDDNHNGKESDSTETTRQTEDVISNYGNNITLLWDLSNRVNRPESKLDTFVIGCVLDTLKSLIQNSIDRNIYKDNFKIHSINDNVLNTISESESEVLHIGIDRVSGSELEISNYLYCRVDPCFDSDVNSLKSLTRQLYIQCQSNPIGADLWHFFNNNLNEVIIDQRVDTISYRRDIFLSKMKNKVILLTDGYIEAYRYGEDPTMIDPNNPNLRKYLSSGFLNEFRNSFRNSGLSSVSEYFQESGYGIVPIGNENFKNMQLLIIGIDDRTIINGVTTVSPPDSELILLFWKDWLIKSGLSEDKFTIISGYQNRNTLKKAVSNFLYN